MRFQPQVVVVPVVLLVILVARLVALYSADALQRHRD